MKPQFLHAGNPGPMTGDGNWTYLIGAANPVLIDAGVGNPPHLDAIARVAPGGPSQVVVTHAHRDHVGGAPAIHQRWPSAVFSKYPWPARDPDLPWRPLDEAAIVATDEGDLTVLHTPGHSPDHLTLWHPDSRTVFVGDLLVQGGSVVILASHGGSLAEYLRSLERLLELNPRLALPSHGPAIEDPAALIHQYFEHRAQREQQVLEALGSGATTADAITARIYTAVSNALLPMARESVLAHLAKLEQEHRVSQDDGRWLIKK